jgi:hypothetical protein
MNLATVVIDPDEAKQRYEEYREAVAVERSSEDEAIAAGYRAAARGLPLIELSATIKAGGTFKDDLPKLAVCRADFEVCWVHVERDWFVFSDTRWPDNRGALVGKWTVRVARPEPGVAQRWSGSTIVPIIPPRLRPKRYRLHRYHLLWEVESWTPEPPHDPALLKHVRGDLWAVVATWDLTELERAVLRSRA